jgi:hypothetical protein
MKQNSCKGGNGERFGHGPRGGELDFDAAAAKPGPGQTAEVWRFRFGGGGNPQDVDWGASTGPAAGAVRWDGAIRVELFFGLGQGERLVTSEHVWDAFERELRVVFPQGFTMVNGVGVWGPAAHEPSRSVIAFTDDTGDLTERVAKLAAAWSQMAGQQEVLAVMSRDHPVA